ncbi:MAG: hypothetical protein KC912_10490 [Proteobacteria bacterium]|nr:hypothetical protein [Pseudomonadota bacterium]
MRTAAPFATLVLAGCLIRSDVHDSARDRVQSSDSGDSGDSADTDNEVCDATYGGLLVDGSFETFVKGSGAWSNTGASSLTLVDEADHCDWALRIDTEDYRGIGQRFETVLVAGDVLELSLAGRYVSGDTKSPDWVLYVEHSGGERQVGGSFNGYVADGVWHAVDGQAVIPSDLSSDATAVRVLLVSGSANQSVFDIDRLQVIKAK